jgi:hypothetical protein
MRALALGTIAVLLVLIVVLSRAVVRLENYHHASETAFCGWFNSPRPTIPSPFEQRIAREDCHDPNACNIVEQGIAREDCLNQAQTRTHWWAHILYATGVL